MLSADFSGVGAVEFGADGRVAGAFVLGRDVERSAAMQRAQATDDGCRQVACERFAHANFAPDDIGEFADKDRPSGRFHHWLLVVS